MKDPERLLKSGTDLEASLLGSAQRDAPREGLDRRVHAALGLGGIVGLSAGTASVTTAATATAATAAKGLPILVSVGIAKWAGVALLGTGIAVGTAAIVHREMRATASATAPSYAQASSPRGAGAGALASETMNPPATRVSTADIPPPPPILSVTPVDEPVPAAPAVPRAATAIPVTPVLAPSSEVSQANPSPGSPEMHSPKTAALEDEVAILNQAHAALASGNTALALKTLDRHDLDYVHGALTPEALEVRIEAYAQRHDETKVAELAQAFLARYPGHPLTAKVRSLLERP
jgi:hypothetical protein